MKKLLVIVFSIVFITANGQNKNKNKNKDNNIVIGTIGTVYSKILNEKRTIWVYVPKNNDPGGVYSKQHYPVVYLLDGDGHFYSVMGMIQQLSEVNGNTTCPQMIIIGILNTDRNRDLTPTHDSTSSASGGGENFTAFLEKELIPHIDSAYPTMPYKMLIGHSYGGLMAVNTLINHPGLFNSYIAIDPSLFWNKQKLLNQADSVLKKKNFNGKSLFLAIANTMHPGMDTLQVRKDTTESSLHIRSMLQLSDMLKSNADNGLRWSYKYYPEDDHGSVPLIAEYDALRFIFRDYKLPSFEYLFEKSVNTDSVLTTHFKNISRQMDCTMLPPESFINELGYASIAEKMLDKAYTFFNMNVRNYPQSSNVYDSMGDFYSIKGDKGKSIEYYEKALTLRNTPHTREKLERLKKTVEVPEATLETYVGAYEFTSGFCIEITREGKQLFSQGTGQVKVELFAKTEEKFFTIFNEFIFDTKGKKGMVDSLIIIHNGKKYNFKKIK
jgi:uncharacterized protein